MRRILLPIIGALLAFWLGILPALAHPHIFIDAKATIAFNDAGQVIGIHNEWTFDAAYSAWAIQGLDTDGDGKVTRAEMQDLANDNMSGLSEYEYYTFAGEGPGNLKFVHGSHPTLDFVDDRVTLNFDVALDQPYAIKKQLQIAVNDPEYYVAITFGGVGDVKLQDAPKNCTAMLEPGHTMPDAIADELYALPADVTKLPPELEKAMRGVQGAILVNCPGGSLTGKPVAKVTVEPVPSAAAPATALDAATAMAETPPANAGEGDIAVPPTPQEVRTPVRATRGDPVALVAANSAAFTGALNEPGLIMPRTGFLGWVAQQQKDFYEALTAALGRLKTDWTAFWVLGGLSFLYGIFHAAGPGHGKVVISSYVLASEAEAKRGMWLSFVSAMIQSLTAVVFIVIAAAILRLTSVAMSDAVNWIGILSYAMVALLGLWLIARKLFGWGHKHNHAETHAPDAAAAEMVLRAREKLYPRDHALAHDGPAMTRFRPTSPDAHGRLPDDPHYGHSHGSGGRHDHDHGGHAHVVTPQQLRGGWKEQFGVVLAVGLRPCSGALVVLVFALSQGLLAAGIAAVFLMGLGTAITTGTLAVLAVTAKGVARRLAGVDNKLTAMLVWWAELLGAVAVFGFGVILVLASI